MASSNKRRSTRLAIVIAVAIGAAGCELIVDFDRTKIDGGGGDGSTSDVTTQDVTNDTNPADVVNDVKSDASDSGSDAADAANDASDAGDGALDDGADASDGD